MSAIEHHYAEVNGLRLHYAAAGAGPLMLFVHGFPEFWYCWHAQLAEFSRDHFAVAPDLRGFNLSDKPSEVRAYRPRHVVEDLRQLIGRLGGGRCILVAHDWGGAAAWNLAAAHPECVEKLVIVNAPHPVPFARALANDPAQQAASQYMRLFREARAERLLSENDYERLARMMGGWSNGGQALTDEELALYRQAWSQPGALTGGLNYYRASPMYPPAAGEPNPALAAIDPADFIVRVPTLVIWGERDTALLPCLLDGLEAVVPDLRVARIPEGSHWVIREQPQTVNRLIRQLLES